MKTFYDLEKKQIDKYKKDFKKTKYGKETNKTNLSVFAICIISFIIATILTIKGTPLGFQISDYLYILTTISLIWLVIRLFIYEIDFRIWLNKKLDEKKK